MFAELMAAIMAVKEIAATLKLLVAGVDKLRQDAIDSALSDIRKDVNETINKIQSAKTNDERAVLARELNSRISL